MLDGFVCGQNDPKTFLDSIKIENPMNMDCLQSGKPSHIDKLFQNEDFFMQEYTNPHRSDCYDGNLDPAKILALNNHKTRNYSSKEQKRAKLKRQRLDSSNSVYDSTHMFLQKF